jgi:hypothetical protein
VEENALADFRMGPSRAAKRRNQKKDAGQDMNQATAASHIGDEFSAFQSRALLM